MKTLCFNSEDGGTVHQRVLSCLGLRIINNNQCECDDGVFDYVVIRNGDYGVIGFISALTMYQNPVAIACGMNVNYLRGMLPFSINDVQFNSLCDILNNKQEVVFKQRVPMKCVAEPAQIGDPLCIACSNMKATICFDCGHQVYCDECVLKDEKKMCPICRHVWKTIVRPIIGEQKQ